MWPDLIVVSDPALRQHLCFIHCVKNLSVEEFSSHASVETFDISVFPWAARLNIGCNGTRVSQPFANAFSGEFTSVIASHILWNPACQHEIRQNFDDIVVSPTSTRYTGKTFVRVFVQNVQESNLSTVAGSIFYKIITPYMILMLCSQTNAAAIR